MQHFNRFECDSAPFLQQHFWCNIIWCAYSGIRQLATIRVPFLAWPLSREPVHAGRGVAPCGERVRLWNGGHFLSADSLAQPKIRQLDMPVAAEQQVVWLDVSARWLL